MAGVVSSRDPLRGNVKSVFWRYAIPEVIGLLAIWSAGLVDSIFLGHFVGPQALATVNLAIPAVNMFFSLALLIGVGGGGLLYVVNSEAKRQIAEADVQRQHAADMQQLAEQRDEQRKVAEQAEQTALAAKADVDSALSVAEQDREAAVAAQKVAEAAKERGRRLQYATDMQLVPLLWRDRGASIAQLKSRLDAHNPELNPELQTEDDLRGFEWYYLSEPRQQQRCGLFRPRRGSG